MKIVEQGCGESAGAVILVHGLWMHGLVFLPLGRRLARHGFCVRSFSYPSVRQNLDASTRALARYATQTGAATIDFVGHSLGGLLVLNLLAQHPDSRFRRVVLLGSPFVGSHCASSLLKIRGISKLVGQAIRGWLERPRPQLPANVEIGVIAGSRSLGLGRLIPGLPTPNDGVVSVAETRLPASTDAITLKVSHAEMLLSSACASQVAAFLDRGRFIHA